MMVSKTAIVVHSSVQPGGDNAFLVAERVKTIKTRPVIDREISDLGIRHLLKDSDRKN
jgi:hypothetical protein